MRDGERVSPSANLTRLKQFCRDAGRSPCGASVSALAVGLGPRVRILRFERDLAVEMARGLCERFNIRNSEDLLQRRHLWEDVVDEAFGIIEQLSRSGAKRALWAQLARMVASGLPPRGSCVLGPIHCAVFDTANPESIVVKLDSDAIVVSLRNNGSSLCVVEMPPFRETTLGTALHAAPAGDLATILVTGNGPSGVLQLTAGRVLASLLKLRSVQALWVQRQRTARLLRFFKKISVRRLQRLNEPIFTPSAASAKHVVGKIEAELPRGSARDNSRSETRTSHESHRPTLFASPAIPVLMYHRIVAGNQPIENQFSVALPDFESQLDLLQKSGYYTITSAQLGNVLELGSRPPGRPVLITFDDGYADFATLAYPALKRRNFNAEVFLVTDLVGKTSIWDRGFAAPAPLMDWQQIRCLHQLGIAFGSHLTSHSPVTHLTSGQLLREAVGSRITIERELGTKVSSVALPFGLYDDRIAPILEWSGYRVGFSTDPGLASPARDLLRTPRINVRSDVTLDEFRKLLRGSRARA